MSDPWHHAAQCTVANLRYYPNKLLSEAEVKVIARDRASTGPAFRLVGPHTLTPGAVLAQPQQIPSADSYTWAFWVKPRGVPTHWGSILHHGEFNHERSPAIWFIPGTLRLHVRVATQFDHNNGIDTPVDMRVNRWTHVAVVARERDLWVGACVCVYMCLQAYVCVCVCVCTQFSCAEHTCHVVCMCTGVL